MNDDGSDKNGKYHYFHAGSNGKPDFSNPMNKEEIIQLYRDTVDNDPTSLADLYTDFYIFSRIEFIIFNDRICSAILLANSAKERLQEVERELPAWSEEQMRLTPGWKGEVEMVHGEAMGIVKDTYSISIGSTIVTSVAALESLLIDLMPESEAMAEGLHDLLQAFLKQHKVPKAKRKHLTGVELKVSEKRNKFAHALTGSYFAKDGEIETMFTQDSMEDTLYKVCHIAVELEELLLSLR